uniref:Uncharacterized protein n=1 Tax=Neogobius melanostomus TaxID=47308 RepID=A0A8C6TK00_9GOBI
MPQQCAEGGVSESFLKRQRPISRRSVHDPHLDEWQRRSFDISSGSVSPRQTADALRAHVLDIQYAWADSQLSRAARSRLLRCQYSDEHEDETEQTATKEQQKSIYFVFIYENK